MSSRRNKTSGLSGFVSFMKRRDAEEALREFDGFDWGGSVLRVGWSKAVPVGTKAMYSKSLLSSIGALLTTLCLPKLIPRRKTVDVPGPDQDLATGAEIGIEIEMTEAGLALDTAESTRAGGVDPVRIAQVVLGRPEGETTGTETAGVVIIGGRDPTAGHALLEGTGIEDMPKTPTRKNSWVTMTLLRSSSELLLWKSKVEVKITKLR